MVLLNISVNEQLFFTFPNVPWPVTSMKYFKNKILELKTYKIQASSDILVLDSKHTQNDCQYPQICCGTRLPFTNTRAQTVFGWVLMLSTLIAIPPAAYSFVNTGTPGSVSS